MTPNWTPRALADVTGAIEYIRADNPAAANQMIDRILEVVNQTLMHQPNIGKSGRVAHTREFVVHPSYILVYRTKGNSLDIIAFRHTAQKWPKKF
jgi:addiction module RelE/StbE family toxin